VYVLEVLIDGKKILTVEQLHHALKESLQLPEYYGENLNALWDCLTAWVEFPLKIRWENFEKSREFLGDFADDLLELFQEAEEELDGFTIEIV
jgi:ribonuclease inhibitor